MFSGNLDFCGEEVFWLANPTPDPLDALPHQRRKGERSRPDQQSLRLSRFCVDGVVYLLARFVINLHVVLFAAMLFDFGHDLCFTISADLPVTVLRANVRAAKIKFLIALRFVLSDCHVYPPAAMFFPIR
jgi:hypothetical protein